MKQKDIILIVIPAFIITALWVIFSIYHNLVASTISSPLSVQIQPISGTFDTGAIENIKKRIEVEPIYQISTSSETSASQAAEPTPVASSEGDLLQ